MKQQKRNTTEKEVADKVNEINKKKCSSNFVSTSRDRRQFIFRNKTFPPEVGKYSPNLKFIEERAPEMKLMNQDHKSPAKERKLG